MIEHLKWVSENAYSVMCCPHNEGLARLHSVLAIIKFRNNRYHMIIHSAPNKESSVFNEGQKLYKPVQRHFDTREEAVTFIEGWFKCYLGVKQ